ncbi:hypothetical protein ACHQM5_026415 [Ranunculus cassubicifolius]
MAIVAFSEVIPSAVPAAKLFKANVLDAHILSPKALPEIVASATFLGDGGVGSVRQFNFTEVVPYGFIKERIDIIDNGKFMCKFTSIGGGDIGKKLETATSDIKVESTSDGGSIYMLSVEYIPLPGIDYSEADIEGVKNAMVGMFKAIEGYLIANPNYV